MGKTNIIVNVSYVDGKVTKQYGLHFKDRDDTTGFEILSLGHFIDNLDKFIDNICTKYVESMNNNLPDLSFSEKPQIYQICILFDTGIMIKFYKVENKPWVELKGNCFKFYDMYRPQIIQLEFDKRQSKIIITDKLFYRSGRGFEIDRFICNKPVRVNVFNELFESFLKPEEIYKIKTDGSLFGFKCLDSGDIRTLNNLVFEDSRKIILSEIFYLGD